MELSPSWEAASCSATQEFINITWNPKLHYRVYRNPPLVPILSQINALHNTQSYLSKICFNIMSNLRFGLLSGPFPSGFPTNILYAFLVSPIRATCPAHSKYTWRRVQVMKLLIMQFSPTSCHFIPLRSKYSPQHPVLKHPQYSTKKKWGTEANNSSVIITLKRHFDIKFNISLIITLQSVFSS
jgi:hypothetical protein